MDANSFVGIPYKHGACGHDGCDCWGLVRLVEMEAFGVFLPAVQDERPLPEPRDIAVEIAEKKGLLPLELVTTPQDGDIVLMHFLNVPCHVGVIVNGQLLHADPLCRDLSRMARLTDPRISARIEGYYRVRSSR
jgi:murein DD-endopeptidase / murein LD-carboxypeptidase